MSGGIPGLRVDPTDDNSSHEIVYAAGWSPNDDAHDRYDAELGGDDFGEHVHLTDVYGTRGDGTRLTLLQAMRIGAASGYRSLVIELPDPDTFVVRLSRTGPQ